MNSIKTFLFLFLVTIITPSVWAQKTPIKFGKIDEKDLKMTVYGKDSSASAVILCDYGSTFIDYSNVKSSFEIVYFRHVRIKIFKADADVLDNLAKVEVPYTVLNGLNQESFSGLKAVTYQLDGDKVKEIKMEKSSVFEKELYKNNFVKKFTLPEVKDGVIIEYQYTLTSDFETRPRTWYFQGSYPIIHSEYRFSHPDYYSFAFNQEGYHRLAINEREPSSKSITITYKDRSESGHVVSTSMETSNVNMDMLNYRWVMSEVPALRSEPYITTPSDYYDKMEFQLDAIRWPNQPIRLFNDNWSKFAKNLLEDEDIGGRLKKRGAVKDLVKTIIQDKTTQKDKVLAITDYIKSNISVKTEGAVISDRSLKKVLEEKVGAIGDVNLLLGAMCIEAGLKVKPVLLSTREHGRVAMSYPIMSRFNYLIMQVQVDTNYVLVDASEPFLPLGVLPYEVLNGKGFLLDEEHPDWVNLQATKTVDLISVDVAIENGKTLKGTVQTAQKSYEGLKLRKELIKEGHEKPAKALLEKLVGNGSLKSQEFENIKNPYESLKGKFEMETSEFIDVNNEHIYFSPTLSFGYTSNPFKKTERLYPIDFAHPFDKFYNVNLKVPAGYIVEELPKPTKIQWEDGSVLFSYIVVNDPAEGMVKISSKIQFKKPIFQALEYEDLKKTFDTIIAKQSEQIVLKKQAK